MTPAAVAIGRGGRLPLLLAGAAFAVAMLATADPYAIRLLTVAGVYALLGIGYHFAFGQAGLLSLAQGAFFGLGAYATGVLASRWGLDAFVTLPVSILLPVLVAAVVALPVLRLESHYFALATLGVAQTVLLVAVNWNALTGGANGIPGIPGLSFGGLAVGRGWPLLIATWIAVAIGAAIAWGLASGRLRLAWQVAREDELAARSIGLDVGRLRLAALLLSAAFAGAAGALQVHGVGVVSPEVLQFGVMVAALTLVVVGGRHRIAGAILGAVLIVHLPEWLRFLDRSYLIAYGAALLVTIVLAPDGITGRLEALAAKLRPAAPQPPPRPRPLPARPSAGQAVLEVRDVAKRFGGVTAIDGVSLDLEAGEILGLIGPNGSGKTTLLNLISGIERPDRGTIRLFGSDAASLPLHARARAGLARSFQTPRLASGLSLLDNVAAARIGAGASYAAAAGQAMMLLERFNLAAEAGRSPAALPPGLLRRTELARALALQPRLLLLDEPAAGLTPAEQADLAQRLRAVAAEGAGLLIVEHNLPFLTALAGRLICLDAGKVIAEGKPEAVRADPRVAAVYLGLGR
ncbi:MAG: branched-chain amino acid ABC transporter [Alphaproteobacteria bacterium]|nr:MAG: branched-chain amino acid ABC transporter [Alphaproteobacteria bacterium]